MRSLRNLLFLLVLAASLASATVVTFLDRTDWQNHTTGRTDIDFESLGLAVGGYQGFSNATGLTGMAAGVTFSVDPSTYWLYAFNPALGDPQNFGSNTIIKIPYGTNAYLAVTLPSATTSFGLDLMTAFPAAGSFRVQLDGTDVATVVTQPNPTRQFFGVTTDAPITQVRIYFNSGDGGTLGLFDNVAFGAAGTSGGGGTGTGGDPGGETPEAATLLCVGSGLVMMRWIRRRQPDLTATAGNAS